MRSLTILSLLSTLALTACGAIDQAQNASATAADPTAFFIKPLGVDSSCLHFGDQTRVTDHRTNPPRTYYKYRADKKACSQVGMGAALDIKYFNHTPYNGQDGNVYIFNRALGLCLTNPMTLKDARHDDSVQWAPCNLNGEAAFPQMWFVTKNANGAVRIVSNLQFLTQQPNGQAECIEGVSPTALHRQVCGNLNNWMIKKGG